MNPVLTTPVLLLGVLLSLAACGDEPEATTTADTGSQIFPEAFSLSSEQRQQLAHRIVTTSAGVRPGEVVVVNGGSHTLPLLEDLTIEANKAGGFANLWVTSDRILRSYYTDVPESYLAQEPRYLAEWVRPMSVWIGLSETTDPKAVFSDIPEARFAKARKAGQALTEMINHARVRVVFVDYPTPDRAETYGLDSAEYASMVWRAVAADYTAIAATGRALRNRLRSGKEVRITSAAGTDLRFQLGNRPVFLEAGIVSPESARDTLFLNRIASLPGGSVFVAPIESSANGVIVSPDDQCRLGPLRNARFEFRNGQMTRFTATEGEACVRGTFAAYPSGADRLGVLTIGLNPELSVTAENGRWRPDRAAGLVTIALGENRLFGGTNAVEGEGGFSVSIPGATVTVDGILIVESGNFVSMTNPSGLQVGKLP
jgi:leucyl aminopeptidase (aminopeptidase T)